MNIAIDGRSLQDAKLTGVGEYTRNLIKNILVEDQKNKYFVFFNTTKELPPHARIDAPNITLIKFNFPNKLFNLCLKLTGRPRLDKMIENKIHEKIDLFLLPNLNFFESSAPYIITCHDLSFKIFPGFFSPKSRLWHYLINPRKLYQKASRVIAVSNNTKKDLEKIFGIPSEKVTAIASGLEKKNISPDNLQKKYSLPPQYFLALGTIEPRKNFITLIEAFELWCQKNNQSIDLVIAGRDGWQGKKLRERVKSSAVSQRIHLINYVAETDKPSLYAGAKIFIFPSYYEGFGFPTLEAMQCGIPVITADNSALTEINGAAAYYVSVYNISALATGLENLLQPEIADWYRERGHEQTQLYSWRETAKRTLSLFESLNEKSA